MTKEEASIQLLPSKVLRRLREENHFLAAQARLDAERRRRKTQQRVDELVKAADAGLQDAAGIAAAAECRREAATARAASVYKKVDEIVAQADLETAAAQAAVDIADIRIDDLDALFANRAFLAPWLRRRIEIVYAKIHWINEDGQPDFFNRAVHQNHIPLDKALCILAHIKGADDGTGAILDGWIDAILECGLFSRVKRGKSVYQRRCQQTDHCDFCNYVNVSDGLKTLFAAYDSTAFNNAGTAFALTIAPRANPADAKAVGRTITPADWDYDQPDSIVYKESRQGRAFLYPNLLDQDDLLDWELESKIRRFLGAAQFVLGKLVKNGWLDGVRGKVENSVQFLPYASHQHWHAIGSSRCEHDPQKMAEFIKAEVDAILVPACLGVYADVVVAVIPSATDLRKWVKYANKPICLVEAVNSVYNRYPDLGHRPALKAKFLEELRLYPQRSKRVFGMIRCSIDDERGQHTYNLNRRYVAGNHRFKRGGVLTEPERHRLWRERHAERATAKRKAGLEAQEDRVLGLLDQRAQKPWPENTLKAQDVQRVCHCKETKARGILTRLKLAGKLIPKKRRCKPGQPSTEFYMKASRAKPKRARSPALPNPSHSALRCPLPEATQAHHLDLQVVMRAIRASRLLGNCLPILHQVQVDKERDCPSLMKMSRTAAISNTENGVYDGLRPRSPKKWPKNSVSARDLQRARIALTSTEATAILSQMEDEGKIIGQDQQAPSGGHRATSESHHADVMRALRNTIQ